MPIHMIVSIVRIPDFTPTKPTPVDLARWVLAGHVVAATTLLCADLAAWASVGAGLDESFIRLHIRGYSSLILPACICGWVCIRMPEAIHEATFLAGHFGIPISPKLVVVTLRAGPRVRIL